MDNEMFDFRDNPTAELAFLRLLLHQKGLSYQSAERAIEYYEMERRLTDDHERCLLLEYGYTNIAEDIYRKVPIGDQWSEHEQTLFSLKELATSRCRYHILTQVLKQRACNIPEDEEEYDY